MKSLAIDLYSGLGGWTEGLLVEGWDVIGFDIERHCYQDGLGYPAQLVLQDVLTIDGRQFKNADLIVASPPCQRYSYMAMPWKRAKAMIRQYKAEPERQADLNALFNACFRIQREASEAAGRRIPMVVENVRGAIPWVGPSKARYGSYYLWGDVAMVGNRIVADVGVLKFGQAALVADSKNRGAKQPGRNFHFPEKHGIPSPSFHGADHEPYVQAAMGIKNAGQNTWFGIQSNGDRYPGQTGNPVRNAGDGVKVGGDWFHDSRDNPMRKSSSRSAARKHASAVIAKIPLPLARHIARIYKPNGVQCREGTNANCANWRDYERGAD